MGAFHGVEDVTGCLKRMGLPTTLPDQKRALQESRDTRDKKSVTVCGTKTTVPDRDPGQKLTAFEEWYAVPYRKCDFPARDEYNAATSLSFSANGAERDIIPPGPKDSTINVLHNKPTYCVPTQLFTTAMDLACEFQLGCSVNEFHFNSTVQDRREDNGQDVSGM